jgi:hypothetical protein
MDVVGSGTDYSKEAKFTETVAILGRRGNYSGFSPSPSNCKFRQGPNKFRILSAPIIGYEYWTEDRKPVRSRELWRTIPYFPIVSSEITRHHARAWGHLMAPTWT